MASMPTKESGRRKTISRVIGYVLALPAAIGTYYLIPDRVSPNDFTGAWVILCFLTMAWSFPLAAIHEAGHALAATRGRLRIGWFHVGPVVIAGA